MVPAVTSPDPASASSSSPDVISPPLASLYLATNAGPDATCSSEADRNDRLQCGQSAGSSALPNSWAAPCAPVGRPAEDEEARSRADAHVADRGPSTARTDAASASAAARTSASIETGAIGSSASTICRWVQATDTWLRSSRSRSSTSGARRRPPPAPHRRSARGNAVRSTPAIRRSHPRPGSRSDRTGGSSHRPPRARAPSWFLRRRSRSRPASRVRGLPGAASPR